MPESKEQVQVNSKAPARTPETKGTSGKANQLEMMHDFIAAVQQQDMTTIEAPEAEKALMLFRALVNTTIEE